MAFFDRLIRPHFDGEFFEQVAEAIDAACVGSRVRSYDQEHVHQTQRANAEGQDRYFSIQAAVAAVTEKTGGESVIARYRSFPFPLGRHKRFLVTASCTDSLDRIKRSKARKHLATYNSVLEPYQPDFFLAEPHHSASILFGILVIAKPDDDGLPPAIYFGVPTSFFQSWHFYAEIGDVIAMYNSVPDSSLSEDSARIPRLRRISRSRSLPSRRAG